MKPCPKVNQDPIRRLNQLIKSDSHEEILQKFLERNPSLVAGIDVAAHGVVISKLPLGADFRVDFAYVFNDSGGNYIRLIEIERPSLAVFTEGNDFTSEFTHAFQQVVDWFDWSGRHLNYLEDVLRPLLVAGGLSMPSVVLCNLIAGRREQLSNGTRKRRWASKRRLAPKGLDLRTWDGFAEGIAHNYPQGACNAKITCSRYRNGSFVEL